MSYCRWSSDNWKCDLYCYRDVSGGWTTHIAANRIIGNVPEVSKQLLLDGKVQEYLDACQKQDNFVDYSKGKRIGLPYDNWTFNDPDLSSFLKRLLSLRKIGYLFPDYVIEEVKQEMTEGR